MKWLQTEHLWLERYDFSFSQSKTKVTSDEWKWFKKQAGLRMLTGKSLTWQVWVVWGLLLDWGVLVVGTSRLADTSKPPTTIITAFPVNCTRTAMSRKNNETPRKPCYAQRLSLHLSLSVPIAPKMQCQELTKHKQTHRNLLLCFAHQCTSCFHCTAKNAVLHSCGMKKRNYCQTPWTPQFSFMAIFEFAERLTTSANLVWVRNPPFWQYQDFGSAWSHCPCRPSGANQRQ